MSGHATTSDPVLREAPVTRPAPSSDAQLEFIGKIQRLFDQGGVHRAGTVIISDRKDNRRRATQIRRRLE